MLKKILLLLTLTVISFNLFAQRWKQFSDSAKVFNDQKLYEKAAEYYSNARAELTKDSAETLTYARMCNQLGIVYWRMGKYDKTEPLFLEIKALREKLQGKEHRDYASICNNLGALYFSIGKYEEANAFLLEAKVIRSKVLGNEHPEYLETCNNLGALYYRVKQYDKAAQLLVETRLIRAKVLGTDHMDYAGSCNNLAGLYQDMGQYEEAEQLLIEGKNIREKALGNDHPDYGSSCKNLAALYRRMGKYEKAEPLYFEAKQIIEKKFSTKHPEYASNLQNMALMYEDIGQFDKAESFFLEAKEIMRSVYGAKHYEYIAVINNLAGLYTLKAEYEKAEPLFLEAKKIRQETFGVEDPVYGSSCHNLATLYFFIAQYDKAELLYTEAKQIREKSFGKGHFEYAGTCNNLGLIYKIQKQYKKAELFLLEAKEIREKSVGKDHPDYMGSCDNIAALYREMGMFEKANDYYKELLDLQKTQLKKMFRFTSEAEKQLYINQNEHYAAGIYSFYTTDFTAPYNGICYDVSLLNRNLILSSSQHLRQTIYGTEDTVIRNKYVSWINLREQLSYWYAKPIPKRPSYISDLEEQAGAMEKELTRLSADFRQLQEEINWQRVQQSLKQGEAAIEFSSFQYYDGAKWTDRIIYIANILRKDKPGPELVRLFEKKELDSVLRITRRQNDTLTINNRYAKDSSLYKLIWSPLEKYLHGVAKVYFAPTELLYEIPINALIKKDKERTGDKYRLIQLNSTAVLAERVNENTNPLADLALYGGILYTGDTTMLKQAAMQYNMKGIASRSLPTDPSRQHVWQYLPGTKTEVESIHKIAAGNKMPVHILTGLEATEESVKSLGGQSSPGVLHIATHGFFFPDPATKKNMSVALEGSTFRQSENPMLRSGLTMAGANYAWENNPLQGIQDGILTAYEISNMYMPNTNLAVLSACKTGLGDLQGGEGVYGLQRAFRMAGVKNLIMSLWDVPDAATAEFMISFYKKLFEGQSIDNAFYHTQTTMKNKYLNDPYKWAAWILVR